MAHHPDGEPKEKKVKLRFVIAEAEILDTLMNKESEVQALKESEEMGNPLKENIGEDFMEVKTRLAVGSKKKSGNGSGAEKIDEQVLKRKSFGHQGKSARKRDANMMKGKEMAKGETVLRAAEEDGDMGLGVREVVKLEPFVPNFSSVSNFTIRVPKQHVKMEAGAKEKVHHLPPLPEESSLFLPPSRTLTGIQEIANQLLIYLEPLDLGITLDLHHLAAELDVDVKKIFLVSNVLEAVGMVTRISIKKVTWKGNEAMYKSLVQLHQLAGNENILQQIQDNHLKVQMGGILENAMVDGGVKEDNMTKATTGVIIQRLLMAFLVMPHMSPMSTNSMAKVVSSMGNVRCSQSRLQELVNALIGIGLLQRVEVVEEMLPKPKKVTVFQYVGPAVEEID